MEGVNQVLRKGPASPAAHERSMRSLPFTTIWRDMSWAGNSERAFSLSSTREMPGTGFWLTRGFANDLMLRLSDFYDRFLAESSLPYAVVVSEENRKAATGRWPEPLSSARVAARACVGGCPRAGRTHRAMSRCLRVLTALQARPPRKGDTAPKLADLGLPAAITTDPFDDQPLHLRQLPEGWIVYSVGGNLVDDGGKLDGKTDIGAGPARLGPGPGHVHSARFSSGSPATSSPCRTACAAATTRPVSGAGSCSDRAFAYSS